MARPRTMLGSWAAISILSIGCLLISLVQTEETDLMDVSDPTKKLEETVMTDMLRIVDHKFDTLTTRITSVERAVSNLQFYSIRQFRQISGAIKSTESELETVGKQVGQLEVDGRGSKISLSVLKRQVTELKTSTNYLFGELETSVVVINENIDKQTEVLKAMVEDITLRNAEDTTAKIQKHFQEELDNRTLKTDALNCSVHLSEMYDRTDRRIADLKSEVKSQFSELIQEIKTDRSARELEVEKVINATLDFPTTIHTDKSSSTTPSTSTKYHIKLGPQSASLMFTEGTEHAQEVETPEEPSYDENDERIMQALYNMTDSVLQAVSYLRHTGLTLERILSNTDLMLNSQAEIGRRLLGSSGVPGQSFSVDSFDRSNNAIPNIQYEQRAAPIREGTTPSKRSMECGVSEAMAENIATVIRNGSQLLEVLTDLAQMSSLSLTEATSKLQDEVKRVEAVRTRMATTMLARTTEDKADPVVHLTNTTEKIFKLVEAVASNTGWLPVIYRHVQYSESLNNRSHHMSRQSHVLLRNIHRQLAKEASERRNQKQGTTSPTISNTIPSIPQDDLPEEHAEDEDIPDSDEMTLDRDSLRTIYSTSLQLNRIMPALTKLLAEPDPLFTLVGGGRTDQGRLEIYYNGRWGSYCHSELSHPEADLICRHLGFHGGISAGAGYFGAGAGVSWTINASCLTDGQCAIVSHKGNIPSCSHDEDAGVICDHMLRIIGQNDSVETKTGRLEIHHRGEWLPVCGEGWSGYEARVACQQMGYPDGREVEENEWPAGNSSRWMQMVACNGTESRLDACRSEGWADECLNWVPAGVRCL